MDNFWGNVVSIIDTLDADDKFSDGNFSGNHSASHNDHATIIGQHLLSHYVFHEYCDIGGSIGTLALWLAQHGKHAHVIDGCDRGFREGRTGINKDHYAVFDMRRDITGYLSKGCFELTTAIEVTEHLPEKDIDAFYTNMAHITAGGIHIATLHTGGLEEGNHYTIRPVDWWLQRLERFGKTRLIDLNVPTFGASSWIEIKM